MAAILTLRAGLQPTSYDDAVAVFLTTNKRLVDTVSEWMKEEKVSGLPPIVSQIRLTNFAWLKKPAAAVGVKTAELTALCSAALRPSRETWDSFLQNLRRLRELNQITSDEAAAIVASSFTDEYLAEAEDDEDTDVDSLTEVIQRVKAKYQSDAEAKVHSAETRARVAAEERRQLELRVKEFVGRISRFTAQIVVSAVGVLIFFGLVLSLPGFYDLWPGPTWIGWIPLVAFAFLRC